MGDWMKINGESIYGTKASPWGLFPWGRCTIKENRKGTSLYFSVFDWPKDGKLTLSEFKNNISSATLIANGSKVRTQKEDNGSMILYLPDEAPDTLATVIKVILKGKFTR